MRLLIVDDHPVVITGCRAIFASRDDVETFAVRDGESGVAAYFERGADIAMIDINLPDISGFEVLRRILSDAPEARLIAFSMNADPSIAARAIELGARAYLMQHLNTPAARDQLAVYLNDDPGSGKTLGFYMEGNGAAKAIFDRWLEPLKNLGATRNIMESIGATDHVPFDQVGIPAFTAIKDFRNYDVRTRHTNADLADAVRIADLPQAAVFMAVTTWQAAMRDEPIPRQKR